MKYLILDCNFLCWRAVSAMKDVEMSYENMKTEVIYIFLSQMLNLAQELTTSDIIFTWDSRLRFRREIDPKYKVKDQKEKLTQEEVNQLNYNLLLFASIRQKVVPALGFRNNFIQTGLEADDIIAAITKYYPDDFIIVSRDSDLYQLLQHNVKMYDPITGKVHTEETFMERWGIPPEWWAKVKSIAGCKNDHVVGTEGVAEKTAIKYLKKKLKDTTKAFQSIERDRKSGMYERNMKLVLLPYNSVLGKTATPSLQKDDLIEIEFEQVFKSYGFNSFLDDFDVWRETFKLAPF